jgi:hypothetical protein
MMFAMDDPVSVRVVERATHLLVHGNDGFNRKNGLLFHQGLERFPLQELHSQVQDAAVFAEIVNRDNVGVGQDACRLCLALEPRFVFLELSRGETFGQHRLDGDGATDNGVEALVHYAH